MAIPTTTTTAATAATDTAASIATPLQEAWAARRPASAALAGRARRAIPSGVTHDSRYQEPYPLYVSHAAGSRKWDVDGNEYVDYRMGHGALLLGHNHPAIVAAVTDQAAKGTHYGACHELEVRWAELVRELVPSAHGGKVKFFSSGTEATMMAMRLARAFTGKEKILKIEGHFHGWHDYATVAMAPPYDEPISRGVPKATQSTLVVVPPRDVEAVRRALDSDSDIAGLIMIAGGAGTNYLQAVRDLTRERGVVLIFDEVVTGFRYAPGGAQEYYGVTPDLTTLAKILAGGLPGAAIAGRADILDLFELRPGDAQWSRFGRINHPGTFNANPLSAAAGVACLEIVRDPEVQRKAATNADAIRAAIDDVLRRRGVPGKAGGELSQISISLPEVRRRDHTFGFAFRLAMQVGGVDVTGPSMIVATPPRW